MPINHHLFWNDDTNTPNAYGFTQLKRLAIIREEVGLYFLPDLYTTTGRQNLDWHSECRTGASELWQFQIFQYRAVKIWEQIVNCLKDSPALLGYDLFNEYVLPENGFELLNGFYREAIREIRKGGQAHIVF